MVVVIMTKTIDGRKVHQDAIEEKGMTEEIMIDEIEIDPETETEIGIVIVTEIEIEEDQGTNQENGLETGLAQEIEMININEGNILFLHEKII